MLDFPFLSLILLPLLLPLALYARLATPKLPEPSGDRRGRTKGMLGANTDVNTDVNTDNPAQILRLLLVGDSAAAGVGVTQQAEALLGHVTQGLSQQWTVDWVLEAETGLKSRDILKRLETLPAYQVDVVVLSLGVNDVTAGMRRQQWLNTVEQISELLLQKFSAQQLIFSSLPPMHAFSALPQPLRWYLGKVTRGFNQVLQDFVRHHPAMSFVMIDFPITAEYLAEDGFHPSGLAYQYWGGKIVERVLAAQGVNANDSLKGA